MRGHQFTVENRDSRITFESKKDGIEFCRRMLGRYRRGETIKEEDSRFLRNLLERHPEAQQKIGAGVARFFKQRVAEGTECFHLERTDGSVTDFSYLHCVNAKGDSLYQEFAEACRQAVQPYLDAAKKKHFQENGDGEGKVVCEVTGERVAIYESHLDHKKPMTFQVIVETFIQANKVTILAEMLSKPSDSQTATTFVDEELKARFVEYHGRVCKLRIVKARENLRLGASERITKPKRPVILS